MHTDRSMFSPATIGFLAGLWIFLLIQGLTRPEQSIFAATNMDGVISRLDLKLRNAGITSVNGTLVAFVMGLTALLGGVVTFIGTTSVLLSVVVALVFPTLIVMDIDRRVGKYQEKLYVALVPFLRKMESQIRTGSTPTRAFATAARKDKLISWVLRHQLNDLSLQAPFSQVLDSTLEAMPLAPWVQFVESMQTFSVSGGGELADIISTNVQRISSRLLLRQRLMGDLAPYKGQQIVIMMFAVGIPVLMYAMAKDTFGSLISTVPGVLALLVALAIDFVALRITQVTRRNIEKRLDA